MSGRIARTDEVFIGVEDGWILPGFFAALPNVHPDLRFTYRPFTPQERAVVMDRIHSARTNDEAAAAISRALVSQLKSWDLCYRQADDTQHTAPITLEFVSRLRHPVWNRLFEVVVAQSGISDTDPRWSADEKRLDADAKFEALMSGKPVEAIKLETLEKN